MTESTPASDVPRYLTGDKAGLREFLAKFDVSALEVPVLLRIHCREID